MFVSVFQGQILLVVGEPVHITRLTVRLVGEAHTGWLDKLADRAYQSKECVLNDYLDLTRALQPHCTESMLLQAGRHTISFRTRLPLDVVSSLKRDSMGQIRYNCMAVLDIPEGGESELVAGKLYTHLFHSFQHMKL